MLKVKPPKLQSLTNKLYIYIYIYIRYICIYLFGSNRGQQVMFCAMFQKDTLNVCSQPSDREIEY